MNTRLPRLIHLIVAGTLLCSARAAQDKAINRPMGPLRVCAANPRYFADPGGRPVYLTGSHTWQSLQDGILSGYTAVAQPFDYTGYLNLLEANHHNFIRLWRWELTTHEPQPWRRTGPGQGLDGKPKFDLRQFNQAYFDRLRSRVIAARDRGIYVSIMLFEDWIFMSKRKEYPVEQHPFHKNNNVSGVNGDLNGDGWGIEIHTLQVPEVLEVQKTYVRKVIETVNDLDNVLYEICNEGMRHTREWQYEMVRFIKSVEAKMPKQHPVGMTSVGDTNDDCLKSPADWTSLGTTGWDRPKDPWTSDPPAADGHKVCLLDTDHIGWKVFIDDATFTRAWVWKSFTRGHNTLLMENLSDSAGWIAGRAAMGHTRRLAERVNLAAVSPHPELASTRYCLANPGTEYLVYQPKGRENFSVGLRAGMYHYEWLDPAEGAAAGDGRIDSLGGDQQFKTPLAGHAVLYLKAMPLSKEVELYHWVDFAIEAPGAAAGITKWDVEGSCIWTHENGVVRRTSLLWYSGSGDTYVYRFGGSLQGCWTGRTSSSVAALDGLELMVKVMPSSNPRRIGWSGQRADEPIAWAHQKGPDGELAKCTPILIMMPDVQHWFSDPARMRAFVAEFNNNHGFNGGHISTIGRGWFEVGSTDSLRTAPAAPDVRTFAALEAAASEWSERGGWLHLWMWGKGGSGDFSNLPGGCNDAQSRRINQYIAARLGPVPGWSMGLGWDVEFWADRTKLKWWLNDLVLQLGGWHHWIGHRYSDSDIGQGRDPDPANRGEYLSRGITWNTHRSGREQYAGWEHWFTMTSDSEIDAGLAAVPDRPMMSEDRFRQRQSNWPQKDLRSDDAILKEIPRWATRGVAAIYGRLFDSRDGGSDVWPNKAAIKAVVESIDE